MASGLGGPTLREVERTHESDFAVHAAAAPDVCNRCGFVLVVVLAWGCKNPCPNCGTVYPLGDCSD